MEDGYAMVMTTTATEQQARELAGAIVEAQLAACVQIEAIRSVYLWKGELHDGPEWRLEIKTTASRWAELEKFIKQRHAYETPEIVRIAIEDGSHEYLEWIEKSVW